MARVRGGAGTAKPPGDVARDGREGVRPTGSPAGRDGTEQVLAILREVLTHRPEGNEISVYDRLPDLGMTSSWLMRIVLEVERESYVEFPDPALIEKTFASAQSLMAVVDSGSCGTRSIPLAGTAPTGTRQSGASPPTDPVDLARRFVLRHPILRSSITVLPGRHAGSARSCRCCGAPRDDKHGGPGSFTSPVGPAVQGRPRGCATSAHCAGRCPRSAPHSVVGWTGPPMSPRV